MRLPAHQVCKGQPRPAELCIQPDAEVMQGNLCGQARVKTAEIMGPFTVQAEGMMELLVHGLHNLAYPSHPATEPLGPRCLAIALGRTDDLGSVEPPPPRMCRLPLKAFVDHIRAQG